MCHKLLVGTEMNPFFNMMKNPNGIINDEVG